MVEINAAKQNTGKKKKKKERNEMKTAPKTAGTTLNAPIFTLQVSKKDKRERKDLTKYLMR